MFGWWVICWADIVCICVVRIHPHHIHPTLNSPPCDGHCPLLARPLSEYAATLIMYPKTPAAATKQPPAAPAGGEDKDARPPAKGPTAWQFTLPGGEAAGFVSGGNDAVLFLYKAPGGYAPELLPRLVPCPMVAATLTVTRWIPRWAAVVGGAGSGHEEL